MINETNLLYFQRMYGICDTECRRALHPMILLLSNDRSVQFQIIPSPNNPSPRLTCSASGGGGEGGIPQSLIQLLIFLRFISQVNKNAVCPKNTDDLDTLPRYMHNHNKNWGILALTGLMCLHTSSLIHAQHQQSAEISLQGGWVM